MGKSFQDVSVESHPQILNFADNDSFSYIYIYIFTVYSRTIDSLNLILFILCWHIASFKI